MQLQLKTLNSLQESRFLLEQPCLFLRRLKTPQNRSRGRCGRSGLVKIKPRSSKMKRTLRGSFSAESTQIFATKYYLDNC